MKGKILILGSKGMLGGEFLRQYGARAVGWDRDDVDVRDFALLEKSILSLRPEIIINCAAFNDVDGAEIHKEQASLLNAEFPGKLAEICSKFGAVLVQFSSNYVFDGKQGEYAEGDKPNPVNYYGQTKYLGEEKIKNVCGKYFIVRTSVLFGKQGESAASKKSFINVVLDAAEKANAMNFVDNETNSITYASDLATAVQEMLKKMPPFGIYHIINSGSASWYEFAREICRIKKIETDLRSVSSGTFRRLALRPKKAVLLNTKLRPLRMWRDALFDFLAT